MHFTMDPRQMPDDTLLKIRLQYEGQTSDKVWTYVLVKAEGLWYSTGTGKVPQAAGWGAVERWLADKGRQVLSVDLVTETVRIYEAPDETFTLPRVVPFDTLQP